MAMLKHKKTKKFNRTLAFATALIILIVGSISTTIAFLITGTDPITNIFTPSKVTTEVIFSNDGSSAAIKNVDDTQAYIRAAVVVNWKNAAGNIHSKAPVEGTDYTITFNTTDWIKKDYGDGEVLYYYTSPVDVGASTANLFEGFAQTQSANVPEGYVLTVEVLGSGIQSTPYGVVTEKWKVTVDGNGNISAVN